MENYFIKPCDWGYEINLELFMDFFKLNNIKLVQKKNYNEYYNDNGEIKCKFVTTKELNLTKIHLEDSLDNFMSNFDNIKVVVDTIKSKLIEKEIKSIFKIFMVNKLNFQSIIQVFEISAFVDCKTIEESNKDKISLLMEELDGTESKESL